MASMKSLISVMLLLVITVAVQSQVGESQACTAQLSDLNVCAPFVVPGATNTDPSPACCNALHAVNGDCLCSTLRIAARLPSRCNLQPLNCGN